MVLRDSVGRPAHGTPRGSSAGFGEVRGASRELSPAPTDKTVEGAGKSKRPATNAARAAAVYRKIHSRASDLEGRVNPMGAPTRERVGSRLFRKALGTSTRIDCH